MSDLLYYSTTLTVTDCGHCSIPFAIPTSFFDERHATGKSFYCPNGHSIAWRESDYARARRERDAERTRRLAAEDQAQAAERRSIALKGHLTRLRNRIAAGVCPWCKRSFDNVQSHVSSKHPEHVHKMREAVS